MNMESVVSHQVNQLCVMLIVLFPLPIVYCEDPVPQPPMMIQEATTGSLLPTDSGTHVNLLCHFVYSSNNLRYTC